jgi:hypothetical protein
LKFFSKDSSNGFPIFDHTIWTPVRIGPYEKAMGRYIFSLLRAFAPHIPDMESNEVLTKLCEEPSLWGAAHDAFDEVRRRYLNTSSHAYRAQYSFEEACAQAMYNAHSPTDSFDESAAFFVVPAAIGLARQLGFSDSEVLALFPLNQP